ncbi:Gfa family protein [Abortiporus biennis]
MAYQGGCYCGEVGYELDLDSPEEARTSICHCNNCKKFFGSAFGLTTKVPKDRFKITKGSTKEHVSNNSSASKLYREFCSTCGSGILEYGEQAASRVRYVMTGTLDDPGELPPQGEFFCRNREKWMPETPNF